MSPSGRNQNDLIKKCHPSGGFVTWALPDPMVYAMGYRSFAAPRLYPNSPNQAESRVLTYERAAVSGLNHPCVVRMKINEAPADDRRNRPTAKLITIKRCIAAL